MVIFIIIVIATAFHGSSIHVSVCLCSFAMAWIFDSRAAPGTNPWSVEWGSPESFAGRSPKCYPGYKGNKTPPSKSAPPAAPAHFDDDPLRNRTPTFITGNPHPRARIKHTRSGDANLMAYHHTHGTFAGAEVYIMPNVNKALKK